MAESRHDLRTQANGRHSQRSRKRRLSVSSKRRENSSHQESRSFHSGKKKPKSKRKCSRGSSYDSTMGGFDGGIGDFVTKRYEIFNELGRGTFGRVLACVDNGSGNDKDFEPDVVAVKVIRSIKKYVQDAIIEGEALEAVKLAFNKLTNKSYPNPSADNTKDTSENINQVFQNNQNSAEIKFLKDQSNRRGSSWCLDLHCHFPWKDFYCLVTETLALSLYRVQKGNREKGFCLTYSEIIIKQILCALVFLESCCAMVHTDLKMENVLLVNDDKLIPILDEMNKSNSYTHFNTNHNLTEADLQVKLIDFGAAHVLEQRASSSSRLKYNKKHSVVNTRQYRGPEVTLECGWDFKCDVWSVACIWFELISGQMLFNTHDELEHLALMEVICKQRFSDRSNKEFLRDCPSQVWRNFFDRGNRLRWPSSRTSNENIKFVDESISMERSLDKVLKKREENIEDHKKDQCVKVLKGMLRFDPEVRYNAFEAFQQLNK